MWLSASKIGNSMRRDGMAGPPGLRPSLARDLDGQVERALEQAHRLELLQVLPHARARRHDVERGVQHRTHLLAREVRAEAVVRTVAEHEEVARVALDVQR